MNIGFLISGWDRIAPENNATLRLIHEAVLRGHKVCLLTARNLTIRNNRVQGLFRIIQPTAACPANPVTFYKKAVFTQKMLPLAGLDAIFLRDKQPVDPLVLNFLDVIKDDVFIINDIDGIRKGNNKTYTTCFHDPENAFLPVTHVSKNKDFLLKVIRDAPGDRMILKPLRGHGGSGVIVLEKSAMRNIHSLLDFYIGGPNPDYVVVQEYVADAEHGDIRAILLGGVPIGAARRVPSPEDYRANVHAGGSVQKHELTRREREICRLIAPRLVADGLHLVGVDFIGEKLIEINVVNPGGLADINRLSKVRLQSRIMDFVTKAVEDRNLSIKDGQIAQSRKAKGRIEVADE